MDKDVKTRGEKKYKGGQEKHRKQPTSFGKKRGGTVGITPVLSQTPSVPTSETRKKK
jgi:hypothetical protein